MDNLEREKLIRAYLDGEMSVEQRADFESLMKSNLDLQAEVEKYQETLGQVQEWMNQEAPGEQQVENLIMPQVVKSQVVPLQKQNLKPSQPGGWLWRVVATAAIFTAGFYLGAMNEKQETIQTTPQPGYTVESQVETKEEKSGDNQQKGFVKLASSDSVYYTSEENGRLIIETTLKGSGARAKWVVDGNFKIKTSDES